MPPLSHPARVGRGGISYEGVIRMTQIRQTNHEKQTRRDIRRRKLFPYKMMSPFFVLTGIFVAIPIILMVAISFTDMGLDYQWDFIGLANYEKVLKDPAIPTILIRTIFFVVVCTVLSVLGSILIALMTTYYMDIAYKRENAGLIFRIIWLIPSLTPSVVYAFIWRFVFGANDQALINGILKLFGMEPVTWMANYPMQIMIFMCCLSSASASIILFASAVRQIPDNIIQAAKVDGASNFYVMRKIVMPYLRWPITQKTLWSVLSFFCTYEIIMLLTDGGPSGQTTTFAYYIYRNAFELHKFGFGAALSVILVIMSGVLGLVVLKITKVEKQLYPPRMDL